MSSTFPAIFCYVNPTMVNEYIEVNEQIIEISRNYPEVDLRSIECVAQTTLHFSTASGIGAMFKN
jgi:hypothetical protein